MTRVKTENELRKIMEELTGNKELLHLISVASSCTDDQIVWATRYCEQLQEQRRREEKQQDTCPRDSGITITDACNSDSRLAGNATLCTVALLKNAWTKSGCAGNAFLQLIRG